MRAVSLRNSARGFYMIHLNRSYNFFRQYLKGFLRNAKRSCQKETGARFPDKEHRRWLMFDRTVVMPAQRSKSDFLSDPPSHFRGISVRE